MIKVEILTPYDRYVVSYPKAKTLQEAYKDAFKKLYSGGEEVFESEESILDITDPKDVKHIRVFVEKETNQLPHLPPIVPPAPEERDALEGEVFKRRGYTDLLGKKVNVQYAIATDQGVPFVMIHRVDGQDAVNALSKKNLEKLTLQVAEANQLNGPMVIIPHAVIMEDDVEDYVKDFIADLKKATQSKLLNKQKTARAFSGWNDKG